MLKRIDVAHAVRGRSASDMRETDQRGQAEEVSPSASRSPRPSASRGNKPEWMMLDVIPVIPPDLRPLVPLDGGRFATSRPQRPLPPRHQPQQPPQAAAQELNAPEIIIRNEKRMLQEAVDALFDNGRRGKTITGPNKRPLKSLSDMLKGKQGRFRQNLLGKRVDYSGRSVIVVGPELKLHQCGLPKKMALELFKPFIYNKLEESGYVTTIKSAKKMVEKERPEVWDILEEVIREHPVLLNRAPTLHRLGIQAFEPVLIEGKAIQLHPLVCAAFNADFDGDQMAVHVPLSIEAQMEARVLMMSHEQHPLRPRNGKPIIVPTQDIVLGLYYMTRAARVRARRGPRVLVARTRSAPPTTTARSHLQAQGRLPHRRQAQGRPPSAASCSGRSSRARSGFDADQQGARQEGARRPDRPLLPPHRRQGDGAPRRPPPHRSATPTRRKAGISICVKDMVIPAEEAGVPRRRAQRRSSEIENQYQEGLITDGERYNKVIDIWAEVTEKVAAEMMQQISAGGDRRASTDGKARRASSRRFNPIYIMADSGARGSRAADPPARRYARPDGQAVRRDHRDARSPRTSAKAFVLQYFISTHGARKGLADTALKTANSGYLTRRLVDVAQDAVITEYDCGTLDGLVIGAARRGRRDHRAARRAHPRPRGPRGHPRPGHRRGARRGQRGDRRGPRQAHREQRHRGGDDPLGAHLPGQARHLRRVLRPRPRPRPQVNIGEAVGVIAAQSIGEPGTQLTMRTFHIGGAATRRAEQSSLETRTEGTVEVRRA